MNETGNNTEYPTQLASVFRLLRSGRHLCVEDKADFRDLQTHFDQYESIFLALGYNLERHHQNFFYFGGGSTLATKGLQSITLFMLILFQHLDDNKFSDPDRAWQQTLTNRLFTIDELPHFDTVQRRSLMFSLDITQDNLRDKVLRNLNRLGFINLIGSKQFQFRAPVYRFVELCLDYANLDGLESVEEAKENDSELPNVKEKVATNPEDSLSDEEMWEDVENNLGDDDE